MPKTKTLLSPAEYAVLGLLRQKPAHGYDLQRQLTGRQGLGIVCPVEPAMVYAILKSLSGLELIDGEWDNSTYPPKAIYSVSDAGDAEFQRWLLRPVGRMREVRLDLMVKLFFLMGDEVDGDRVLARNLIEDQLAVCETYAVEIEQALRRRPERQLRRPRARIEAQRRPTHRNVVDQLPRESHGEARGSIVSTRQIKGPWRALLLVVVVVFASTFVVACGGDDDSGAAVPPTGSNTTGATGSGASLRGTISVFAAASLNDAFTEIGKAFEQAYPETKVEFNFAGSSALRTQIEEGAPADVFASANTTHMDALVDTGLAGAPTIFVHNSLVVITPSDNPAGITSLVDLTNSGLKLVLAAEEVPVGGYARQMLRNADADAAFGAGFSDAVLANLVSNESNVKQVVAKIQLGEGDAGIVYGSDVTPDIAPELNTIEVPGSVNVIADYPIATLAETENAGLAQAFVEFVLGPDGQAILAKWGFSTV